MVSELLGPLLCELPDPDAEDVGDRAFEIGVMPHSFDGLSLRVLTLSLVLLLFSTSSTRSCCNFSSAFFRLCAIRPACKDC